MKLSLLCILIPVTAIAAAPANEGPAAVPLQRRASLPSAAATSTLHPQPSDAAAILYPAIYDTNLTDVANLVPQVALQVYYQEPGNGSNAAIVAFEDLKHPTVVLEHSSYITNVTCSKGRVTVAFSSRSMALYAYDSWNANITSGIIFVTNHPTCADAYPAERGWILVSTVSKNGANIVCDYVDVQVQDIMKTVGIYFGQNFVPKNSPTGTSTSSQSSSMSSSGSVTSMSLSVKTTTTSASKSSTSSSTSTTSHSSSQASTSSSKSSSSSKISFSTSSSKTSSSSSISSSKSSSLPTITSSSVSSKSSKSSSVPTMPTSTSSSHSSSQTSTSKSSSSSTTSSSSLSSKSSSLSFTSHSTTNPSSTQSSSSSKTVTSTSSASAFASSSPFNTVADFDTALDDEIGYTNTSAPDFWYQLMPGVVPGQLSSFGTPTLRRSLEKRDWNLVAVASVLIENLSENVGFAQSNVQSVFTAASTAIDAAVADAIGIAIASLNALSPFTLGPFPFSATPNNNATTDFGAGIQLSSTSGTYQGVAGTLTTYCIGCGVTGSFSVTGTILFDAEEGMTKAEFDLTGSIHAQIEIAVIATISASASEEKNLITQGLPALTIPGFLVVGPAIALDVGATVSVNVLGGLAAGYQLNWDAITAHFDILNDDYSASGLTPIGTPILDTEANITSTATLYGLVTLSFGIDVMGGKYKANVGLVDKPEIDAFTEVIVYTAPQLSAMADGTVICVGENFTLGISDSAYADVVWGGVGKKPVSTKTYSLATWAGPTFTTCFGSLSTIHHTSTASTTTPTPSPTPTTFSGPCDPAPEADGYCCPMPPAWVESPAYEFWRNCINTSLNLWTESIAVMCGTNITCYQAVYNPIIATHLQTCPTDTASYEYGVCTYDNFWLIEKGLAIESWATYGKRDLGVDVGKRDLGTKEVGERGFRVEERQAGFVNIMGSATRNSTVMLAWEDDGNLVASQNGTLFATLGGNVIGDTNGRLLHFYETTMGLSEISRLRLASVDKMPVGSILVSLVPMNIGLASPALVAFTSGGGYYFIITCTIAGQLPKLFLTSSISIGIEELMLPSLQDTLTGGVVGTCGLLPWSI